MDSPTQGPGLDIKQHIRAIIGERGRSALTRAQVVAGLRPRFNSAATHSVRYPDGRRAAVVFSADLELAWAWRYARQVPDARLFALERADQGRRNLPVLLDLCDRFGVPVTWATVGHLLLERCGTRDGLAHPELPRVPYFENEYWSYQAGDWFDADPGCRHVSDAVWSAWYGADLVRAILDRPTRHEIGCHTFSHVVFTDALCPPEVAAAELHLCQEVARAWGFALRSFVFPGNLAGNHASLRGAGFASYRAGSGFELDVPRRDTFGLWEIPGGIELKKPYTSWSTREHLALMRRFVDTAIKHGLVCSFWFHPEEIDPNEILPDLLSYIALRRTDLWVTTMQELAAWLDTQEAEHTSAIRDEAIGV